MDGRFLLLAALLANACALAESRVYRCEDGKGHTLIQNAPCPPGTREKGGLNYTPDRPLSASELQAQRELEEWQRARSQRNAGTAWITQPAPTLHGTPGPAPGSREAKHQACKQARTERDAYQFDRNGKADDPAMRLHSKRVQDLCHGL